MVVRLSPQLTAGAIQSDGEQIGVGSAREVVDAGEGLGPTIAVTSLGGTGVLDPPVSRSAGVLTNPSSVGSLMARGGDPAHNRVIRKVEERQ